MQPGELLWTPGPERIRHANVTAFADWLARERGRRLADYGALWRWSVEDLEGFWQALWDYFRIESSAPLASEPVSVYRHVGMADPFGSRGPQEFTWLHELTHHRDWAKL